MSYRTITSDVLYEGRLKAVREQVETPTGSRFCHETIHHPGAVVILPLTNDGKVILIEQYRHSVRGTVLEVVAGTLEAGEDPAVCAQRELSEEIGRVSDDLIPLGVSLPAPGFCDEKQFFFVAKALRDQKGTPDDDEVITEVAMSVGDLEQAIRSGRLNDGKSLAIFCRARLLGLL